jgi:superfamily I DNA and RNA helicase
MAYFDYVNSLFAIHPVEVVKLPFSEVPRIYEHVEKITTDLQSVQLLQTYDLIVIDEAQDLFHKGVDLILDRQLNGGKNGLSKGQYIVFYDSLQAFDKGTNSELYQLVYHIIRESSAFYKLFEYFRTIAGSGIANFLDDTLKGSIDLSRLYGSDMVIKTYKDTDDCIITLKQWIRNVLGVEKVAKKDMVVLFSSNLVSGKNGTKNKRPLDTVLEADSEFEKLDNDNINTISEKIRYTTALKYKGLEKDLVVLVINDLFNEKIQTFYQMYIGASRAKAKVVLLIDEGSARMIAHQKASIESLLVTDYLQ